jgi:Fic family protein
MRIVHMLQESNAIEDVWDFDSLQQAVYAWEYCAGQSQLTPSVILKTHKILMLHQPLQPNEKGYWRKVDVSIGYRQGTPYAYVPAKIQHWCDEVTAIQLETNTPQRYSIKSIRLHVDYEIIHPFVDGNGRTGRIFMNWFRLAVGLPVMVIKEKEKYEYYGWFD